MPNLDLTSNAFLKANAIERRPKGKEAKALAEVRANALDPLALFPDHALQRTGEFFLSLFSTMILMLCFQVK